MVNVYFPSVQNYADELNHKKNPQQTTNWQTKDIL